MRGLRSSEFDGTFISSLSETVQVNEKQYFNYTYNICKEGFVTISIVMYFRKNFYLTVVIDELINRLESGGLIEYWENFYIDKRSRKSSGSQEAMKTTFGNVIGCFQLLAFGWSLALMCFTTEVIVKFVRGIRRSNAMSWKNNIINN